MCWSRIFRQKDVRWLWTHHRGKVVEPEARRGEEIRETP
jgi:hypothetical protein